MVMVGVLAAVLLLVAVGLVAWEQWGWRRTPVAQVEQFEGPDGIDWDRLFWVPERGQGLDASVTRVLERINLRRFDQLENEYRFARVSGQPCRAGWLVVVTYRRATVPAAAEAPAR